MKNLEKRPAKDLTGQQFGRLTAREYLGRSKWRCGCVCGAEVTVSTDKLNAGTTRSCGCLRRELAAQKATKHSGARDPLYHVLKMMHQRCENPNNRDFKWYGALGVRVCEEWAFNNYPTFKEWALRSGYWPGLTIDRIEPSGDYCPTNCRWVTIQEQQLNKRKRRRAGKCL